MLYFTGSLEEYKLLEACIAVNIESFRVAMNTIQEEGKQYIFKRIVMPYEVNFIQYGKSYIYQSVENAIKSHDIFVMRKSKYLYCNWSESGKQKIKYFAPTKNSDVFYIC